MCLDDTISYRAELSVDVRDKVYAFALCLEAGILVTLGTSVQLWHKHLKWTYLELHLYRDQSSCMDPYAPVPDCGMCYHLWICCCNCNFNSSCSSD